MMLPDFNRRQKIIIPLGLMLLTCLALFIKLGSYPLFLEEPRRALIALEMNLGDHWMLPTQFGEEYFKKPPIWNWVIIGSQSVFGEFSEWSVRFFGVVSFLLMGIITWWVGDKYVNFSFGVHAAFLVLTMVDALFYLTVVAGEIDLFYSLITYSSIVLIFFLREKGEYAWMFFLGYALSAVGLLTKGLPSVVFLGITLIIALWDGHRIRKLWSWGHLLGVATFLLIVGWFSWGYSQHGGIFKYVTTIWIESRDKTAVGTGFDPQRFITHLLVFPFENLKNILPGSLLLIFVFRKGFWEQLRYHRLIRYSFWVGTANIVLYWLSPETGSRYLYMLYPLFLFVLLYAYHTVTEVAWREKAFKVIGLLILGLFLVTYICYPFIAKGAYLPPGAAFVSIVMGVIMLGLIYGYLKWSKWRLLILMSSFLLMRIVFDFSVHQVRATDSPMAKDKDRGFQIARVAEENPIFIYEGTRISYTSAFYASRESQRIIQRIANKQEEGLYLIREDQLGDEGYDIYYQLPYRDQTVLLVRFH